MSHRRKIYLGLVLASTTSLIGLAALAQQNSGERPASRPLRPPLSAEDRIAFQDARLAAVHAGLRLNADQEKLWPAVEAALRDMAKTHAAQMQKQSEQKPTEQKSGEGAKPTTNPPAANPFARLRERGEADRARGDIAVKMADAASPLWESLSDEQKKRFPILMRGVMMPQAMAGGMSGGMGDGMMGHMPMGDDMHRRSNQRRDERNDSRSRSNRDDERMGQERRGDRRGEGRDMREEDDRRMPPDGMHNRQDRSNRQERSNTQDRQQRPDRQDHQDHESKPEQRGEAPNAIFPVRAMGPVQWIYP